MNNNIIKIEDVVFVKTDNGFISKNNVDNIIDILIKENIIELIVKEINNKRNIVRSIGNRLDLIRYDINTCSLTIFATTLGLIITSIVFPYALFGLLLPIINVCKIVGLLKKLSELKDNKNSLDIIINKLNSKLSEEKIALNKMKKQSIKVNNVKTERINLPTYYMDDLLLKQSDSKVLVKTVK